MKVYLIPVWLSEGNTGSLSVQTIQIIRQTHYFFVENVRSARRFIAALKLGVVIDELTFFEVHKRTTPQEVASYFKQVPSEENIGIFSEAGCPGIADPGALAVAYAHQKGIEVIPLVGASSILLALMASGFNGQNFAFHGYLPIDRQKRSKRIKELEQESKKHNRTQIFMETPYRNDALLNDILRVSNPQTQLCIAADITSETEFIKTKTIADWKKNKPSLHKRPAIFVLYAK